MLEQRLEYLMANGPETLAGRRVGLEKESLRVDPQGQIARTPHPRTLGSALTHPWITTDYSEAMMEFVTPPAAGVESSLDFLCDLQTFVYEHIGDERLWATSMPCALAGPESIPIADYGPSNPGMMKTVYRRGLGHRYGRTMQIIAGVHFNFSLPEAFWPIYQALEGEPGSPREFRDNRYFGMIRNLQRVGWIIPYLFGASPAVCKSFLAARGSRLEEFDASTAYEPWATSLRMGDIGYTNTREDQTGIKACYDNLDAYVDSLLGATETPFPDYQRQGVVREGRYEQLNANILQIENEYYSTVRPKQPTEGMEKPSLALRRRGVAYVELRSLDVNAWHPLGVDAGQLRFLEALMLYCLLLESPPIGPRERHDIDGNQLATAHRGREPGFRLRRNGGMIPLRDWAEEILDGLLGIAEWLDQGEIGTPYAEAVREQRAAVADPERTPSARMLAEMREHGEGFFEFARRQSETFRDYYRDRTLGAERRALFEAEARRSLEAQNALEAEPGADFGDFLAAYFAGG
ncbi:MAG: glutamate--cysteine ligase [Thiohalospira sp.]